MTGEGLTGLDVVITNLETLTLASCGFLTDPGLCEFLRISEQKLKHLDLSFTGITGEGVAGLDVKVPNFETLILNYCKKLTKACVNS